MSLAATPATQGGIEPLSAALNQGFSAGRISDARISDGVQEDR